MQKSRYRTISRKMQFRSIYDIFLSFLTLALPSSPSSYPSSPHLLFFPSSPPPLSPLQHHLPAEKPLLPWRASIKPGLGRWWYGGTSSTGSATTPIGLNDSMKIFETKQRSSPKPCSLATKDSLRKASLSPSLCSVPVLQLGHHVWSTAKKLQNLA